VVEQTSVGGVVVGDEDDGPIRVGRPALGDDRRGGSPGKQGPQGPAPRREIIRRSGAGHRGQRGSQRPPAPKGHDPRRDARARRKTQRPPERAVHPFALDSGAIGAEVAQALGHPFGCYPLAV
jgi:hypothetical protein